MTAFYDSRSDAGAAIDKLKAASVDGVRLMPAKGMQPRLKVPAFWAGLADWFFPEDRDAAEDPGRSGFLVSVSVDQSNYDTAHYILRDEGSNDMDERADL